MIKERIDNDKYISILRKVKHKPIIIEFIFSFIKYNTYILFELIEKDKILASSINSCFKSVKKNNNLSQTINYNFKILLFYKIFKEYILDYSPSDIFSYDKQNFSKKNTDPSFINYKLKFILERDSLNIPENEISNIYYQTVKGMRRNIALVYIPEINEQTKKIYVDGKYIEDNINNEKNCFNQTIENLICIIDDNEYYNKVKAMNKNISINRIYFLIIIGNKKKKTYSAINSYLKKINAHSVMEIIVGTKSDLSNFLKNDIILNKKSFVLSGLKSIKLNITYSMYKEKEIYLGLSLLFPNSNTIGGVTILDCKKEKNIYEKLDKFSGKTLILKVHSLSFLKAIKKKHIDIKKISSLIIYISEDIIKNAKIKNMKNIFSYFQKAKSLLIYSEVELKEFQYTNIQVIII